MSPGSSSSASFAAIFTNHPWSSGLFCKMAYSSSSIALLISTTSQAVGASIVNEALLVSNSRMASSSAISAPSSGQSM